jgi:uncharacterized alkaline shock family protein YloU
VNTPHAEDRLPCGAEVGQLLDQVDAGRAEQRTEHQGSCPLCQAALGELGELWEPLRELAAKRALVPPGLVAEVMAQVRQLASRVWFAVLPDSRGVTRVAARVIAVIARQAACRVPEVVVALGSSTEPDAARAAAAATRGHRYPGSAVGVAGSHVAVDLALATSYGASIPVLAERVRRAVLRDVRAATGIDDVEVNVTVDDVATE